MANISQHIAAFFDPTVAVNKDGHLVNADGLFDSGSDSTDYISEDSLSDIRDFFYSGYAGDGAEDGFFPSDTGALEDLSDSNVLYDKIIQSVEDQNSAAQTSADRAMEFNRSQAALNRNWQEVQNQKAMDFSERMSNTSFQRAIADLKAAGLNPALAYKLGGSSTPFGVTSSGSVASGSAASMSSANLAPLASVLSSYITGADALDRQNNDFVQRALMTVFKIALTS